MRASKRDSSSKFVRALRGIVHEASESEIDEALRNEGEDPSDLYLRGQTAIETALSRHPRPVEDNECGQRYKGRGDTEMSTPKPIDHLALLVRHIPKARVRADVARLYANALNFEPHGDRRWGKANLRIMERWSPSALIWIKTRAWKLHEEEK